MFVLYHELISGNVKFNSLSFRYVSSIASEWLIYWSKDNLSTRSQQESLQSQSKANRRGGGGFFLLCDTFPNEGWAQQGIPAYPSASWERTLPPMNRRTDTTGNFTFPPTMHVVGKNGIKYKITHTVNTSSSCERMIPTILSKISPSSSCERMIPTILTKISPSSSSCERMNPTILSKISPIRSETQILYRLALNKFKFYLTACVKYPTIQQFVASMFVSNTNV